MRSDSLLDSGVLIRVLRRDRRARDLVAHLTTAGRVMTSSMVVLEVFRGCRNDREQSAAAELFGDLDIVDVTYNLAIVAGRLLREWPGVFSSDKAIPDAIIAASALAVQATLVTLNTRQFSKLQLPDFRPMLIDQEAPHWIPPGP